MEKSRCRKQKRGMERERERKRERPEMEVRFVLIMDLVSYAIGINVILSARIIAFSDTIMTWGKRFHLFLAALSRLGNICISEAAYWGAEGCRKEGRQGMRLGRELGEQIRWGAGYIFSSHLSGRIVFYLNNARTYVFSLQGPLFDLHYQSFSSCIAGVISRKRRKLENRFNLVNGALG